MQQNRLNILNIFKATALLVSMFTIIGMVPAAAAEIFDHSEFDRILKEYVDENGLIDYNHIAEDTGFNAYMESLKTAKVEALSRDGQLAFWINVYNAVTIDKVIKWKPEKSVRETFIPGIWTSTRFYTTENSNV